MLPKLLRLLMKCLLPTFLISTTFLSWILSTANAESKKLWSSPEHPARSASFPEKSCELLKSHFLEVMGCWPKVRIGACEFGTFTGVAHKNANNEQLTAAMLFMLPVDVPSSHVE